MLCLFIVPHKPKPSLLLSQKSSVFWFVPLPNALVVFGCQPAHSTLLILFKRIIYKIGTTKKQRAVSIACLEPDERRTPKTTQSYVYITGSYNSSRYIHSITKAVVITPLCKIAACLCPQFRTKT